MECAVILYRSLAMLRDGEIFEGTVYRNQFSSRIMVHPLNNLKDPLSSSCAHAHVANKIANIAITSARKRNTAMSLSLCLLCKLLQESLFNSR